MKYKLEGVCSKEVKFTVKDGKVRGVEFFKGCSGNLKALGVLLEGMKVEDVIAKLKGIPCGANKTSCSDQFAKVLEKVKKKAK
jgi:uncharacterized protein (TIGR03905 family)